VIPTIGPGGAERVMSYLLSHFANRHDVTLLTFEKPDAAPFYPLPEGIESLRLDCLGGNAVQRRLRVLARPSLLRRSIKAAAPQVIISFMDTTNIATLVSCGGLKIPVVISERIDPSGHRIGWLKDFARYKAYPRARYIVTPTKRVASYFPAALQKKIRVIGNPVLPRLCNANVLYSEGRKRVITVGRCEPQKGYGRLIDAFALIASKYPDWDLVIVGEGPDRPGLQARARQCGLGSRVYFRGLVADVFAELAAAHLMAFPSYYEGFPNALAEGLAAGLPAVGYSGVSGVEDLVVQGTTGLVVDEGSGAWGLGQALATLMDDPHLRAKFSEAARKHVSQWAPDRIFDKWDALLNDCVRNDRS